MPSSYTTNSLRKDSLLPSRDGNGRGEGVEGVAEERVVGRDEAPLVLTNVVHLARHVVVAANHVDFVLEEEGLVTDAQLVHGVKRAPRFALHVEQVHLAVSIRVFAANQDDLCWADGQG